MSTPAFRNRRWRKGLALHAASLIGWQRDLLLKIRQGADLESLSPTEREGILALIQRLEVARTVLRSAQQRHRAAWERTPAGRAEACVNWYHKRQRRREANAARMLTLTNS